MAPKDPRHYRARGWVWHLLKQVDRALEDLDLAIELEPKEAANYDNRAQVYQAQKNYTAALQDWEQGTRLAPKGPRAFNHIAWLRATCPDAKYRDGKKAVVTATTAFQLAGSKGGFWMDTLAAAAAEDGQFARAVQ
ncbi:MAG TPA: hypothetical protein VEL76_14080 [Gemmataceae bacterium]|nr:hypothetical protein [Gemmataceae bacterium]